MVNEKLKLSLLLAICFFVFIFSRNVNSNEQENNGASTNYKEMIVEAERVHRERSSTIKTNELHTLIPKWIKNETNEEKAKRLTKEAEIASNNYETDEEKKQKLALEAQLAKTGETDEQRKQRLALEAQLAKTGETDEQRKQRLTLEAQLTKAGETDEQRKQRLTLEAQLTKENETDEERAKHLTEKAERKASRAELIANKNKGILLPPSAIVDGAGTRVKAKSYQFKNVARIDFGIVIGTEIPVRLDSPATNIQKGFATFVSTKDITGYKKTLPAGTRFFTTTFGVKGSSKLFFETKQLITPSHKEYKLKANISDSEKSEGFPATILNDGKVLKRSVSEGVFSAGARVVSELSESSVAGAALDGFSNNLLDETNKEADENLNAPKFIIQTLPQNGYLIIKATF